jgi:hypothetical protein
MTSEQKQSEARTWVAQTFASQKVPETPSGRGCRLSDEKLVTCYSSLVTVLSLVLAMVRSSAAVLWDGQKPLPTRAVVSEKRTRVAKSRELEARMVDAVAVG